MKKIDFSKHILPHLVAIVLFLVVTVAFFSPVFFEEKNLEQHDILQFLGSSKAQNDFREATGNEALWNTSMFSGMPTYLTGLQWDNQPVSLLKSVLSLGLPHPIKNIFLAFLCYYIMLLVFRVRPYLAIAGAFAFGLSSYMIIGLAAGHNSRIGAIAFMPLVVAGVQLAFTNRKMLGFGVVTAAMALHLRENHLQITYYLIFILGVYAIIKFVESIKHGQIAEYLKAIALLIVGALIGFGSFFGQFWSITEYTRYSIRGPSELSTAGKKTDGDEGLSKKYAFQYKYGIYEPMTLLVPEFYGGSSGNYFVQDENSATYEALMQTGDNKIINQLAPYSSAYWGPQSFTAGPYYAGAIVIFLFVVGILFAERKYVIWLVPLSVLSLMLSWGDSFAQFNYFMFDHFPGYNKFRSVNFALAIILFAMPLLGMLGIEKIWSKDIDKQVKKKLLIALSVVGGLCLLLLVFAGIGTYAKAGMGQLPEQLKTALASDRQHLFQMDAFRSLAFILLVFAVLFFDLRKKMSVVAASLAIVFLMVIDLSLVDKRYFKDESFKDADESSFTAMTMADNAILGDNKSVYRVANMYEAFSTEARTSYFHRSIGGYHGAKLRRYQDFYDSCFAQQSQEFTMNASKGVFDFNKFQAANMLNVKYFMFGPEARNVLPNNQANGNAWFVQKAIPVNSPIEELKQTCGIDTKTTAVIDVSQFKIPAVGVDSNATITLIEAKPDRMVYKAKNSRDGLAVFSEIYYPKGWAATIDGKETEIKRANYILRALAVPAGEHTIEFTFKPKPYYTGNKVTMVSSWIMLLVVVGCIGWSLRKNKNDNGPNANPNVLDSQIKKNK